MSDTNFHRVFLEELIRVAPEIDMDDVGKNDHIQDDLELDSMDVLNLVAALHQRLGIDIPESDYNEISTPARAAKYLASRAE